MKNRVLYRDLPYPNPHTVVANVHDDQLAQILGLHTDSQLKAKTSNKRAKMNSPTNAFGETNVHKLVMLCHTELPGDLVSRLYKSLTDVPKKEKLPLVFADGILAPSNNF